MSYDVFISYSRKDSEVAGQIYNALSAQGLTCFIDLEGISGGTDFTDVIAEAIMGSRLFLLLASKNRQIIDAQPGRPNRLTRGKPVR